MGNGFDYTGYHLRAFEGALAEIPGGHGRRNACLLPRAAYHAAKLGMDEEEYAARVNLASVAYPDDTLRFGYDRDGLVTSASNAAGTVTNVHDAATGWLDVSRGADGTEVSYRHSDGGAVTSVTTVAGTTVYALDLAGRRTRIDSPCGTLMIGYCPWNGLVSAVTNANGIVAAYDYDIMNRVTNITWRTASGARLGGFAYRYDALGRIVSRTHDLGGASFDRAYAYDAMDRLVSDGGAAYVYDAAGNRTTRTGDGGTVAYALGQGDRLASWTGGSYRYDAAGCVTRITRGADTWDLAWNGQYQLVSVSTNGVFAESYVYDALGRRVSTTTLEGTVRHVYDDNWQVIADLDSNGNVLRSYVWGEGIDRLLAVKVGMRVYAALTDVQGTVWGYADESGNVVARWTYDAWGNVLTEEIADPAVELRAVRYRFQGREWSAATGLTNFRMRWYDAVTGRWLSKDPIGLSGGLNLYVFCRNDPICLQDPDGRIAWLIGAGIGGVVGGVVGGIISLNNGGSFLGGAIPGAIGGAITGGTFGLLSPLVTGPLTGAAAGAVSGGLGGAASGAATELGKECGSFDWGAVGSGALGGAVLGGITGGIGGIAGGGLGAPENLGAETLINFDVSIWGGIGSEWSR